MRFRQPVLHRWRQQEISATLYRVKGHSGALTHPGSPYIIRCEEVRQAARPFLSLRQATALHRRINSTDIALPLGRRACPHNAHRRSDDRTPRVSVVALADASHAGARDTVRSHAPPPLAARPAQAAARMRAVGSRHVVLRRGARPPPQPSACAGFPARAPRQGSGRLRHRRGQQRPLRRPPGRSQRLGRRIRRGDAPKRAG